MTLDEASRRFHISIEKLTFYEENGLLERQILPGGTPDYTEDKLRRTGLIHSLIKAGLNIDILKRYLILMENKSGSEEEQIKILRKQRFKPLDDIHEKQQSLEALDYMISEIKKGVIK